MKRIFITTIVVLVGVAGAMAFRVLRDRPATPEKNVILIVLDTFRADKLGLHGNTLGLTPAMDGFARRSVRFDQAFSHAPWTLPSTASLLTSLYPGQHGAVGKRGDFKVLSLDVVTIAELFQRAGATTGAITNNIFLSNSFQMMQGFDTVDSKSRKGNQGARRAGPTTDAALKWLGENHDERFFLLVHYFDAHLTYEPPRDFRVRFADPRDRFTTDYIFGTLRDVFAMHDGLVELDSDTIFRLEKLYNGEVAYLDSQVGRLLQGISDQGLESNTIIVLTADHGEEFLDHGGFEHGHTFYDELVHVPLLIRSAGESADAISSGSIVRTTVRHVDVAPTLCEMVGIPISPDFVGESLVPLLEGQSLPDRPVFSQVTFTGPLQEAWRDNGWKLVRRQRTSPVQLFNLKADPAEQNDVARKFPDICSRMGADLDLLLRALSRDVVDSESPSLTPEEIERLRSLGYMD